MNPSASNKLRSLTSFEDLVDYLRDELEWPIEVEDVDDLVFDYNPAELGIDPAHAAQIEAIKQVRPLTDNQRWGIFYIEFEARRLPIVVMRRILRAFVSRGRSASPDRPTWDMDDLLFISTFGGDGLGEREIAFAHFHQEAGDLPTLRVLGWDGADTGLKLDHVATLLKQQLRWPRDDSDAGAWQVQWSQAFRHRVGHVIRTADALAERLAQLARAIRDAARTLMAHETEQGPLRRLHKAFQTALIHDLTEEDFADTYAQTITYGLLTAAISKTDITGGVFGTALIADNVADLVPITNPFLREMLETFIRVGGRRGGIDFDELGVQDVVDLLRGDETDLPAVLRDFGNRTQGEDPVIHFYEHFLTAYDKQLKVQRGIFYTPRPVVSYIVRSVHELLQTEFGLEDGLASTVTWGEMAQRHADLKIPEGTDPGSPFVVVLDPATGTATFLVEVIDVIFRTMTERWTKQGLSEARRRDAWNAYVPAHLLPRLYGYELMMAPYAIAHMKLGLKLSETGYRFGSHERLRVYLTNALEPPTDSGQQLAIVGWAPALAHEAQAVSVIKRQMRSTVVIGNPPYSVTSANSNPFIDMLMNDYKKHVRGEKGLVALADDYLKFVRLSQQVLKASSCGLWGMITNHGYLKGVIHRGVRQELLEQYGSLFIIDLHGDSNIGEKVPNGKSDKNVFDIQQGVAISIGSRRAAKQTGSIVRHSDSWGTRQEKYDDLSGNPLSQRSWADLHPSAPSFFLIPFDDANLSEYKSYPAIDELMPVNSCGIKTHRDGLVIDFDREVLISRVMDISTEPQLDQLRHRYGISDTPHWRLSEAQAKIRTEEVPGLVYPITYRPFDFRWIYYNPEIIEKSDSKFPTLRHMLRNNVAILTARIQATGVFDAVYAANLLAEMKTAESSRSSTVFPLFLYPHAGDTQAALLIQRRRPNFDPGMLQLIARKLGVRPEGEFGLPDSLTAEDIFQYIYAVLHSPGYRNRYGEFLQIDFPRLPLTSDLQLFRTLAVLGGELVALHLLEDDYPAASWVRTGGECPLRHPITTFIERGTGTQMGAFSKSTCYEDGRVYLDTSDRAHSSTFEGIPQDVWEFQIGGYQVLYKWLYDRRATGKAPGRVLTAEDIAHYQRVVVALKETIRLMDEIDAVIEAHGGWPIQ